MKQEPYFGNSLDFIMAAFEKKDADKLVVAADHDVYLSDGTVERVRKGRECVLVNIFNADPVRDLAPFVRLEISYGQQVVNYDFSKDGKVCLAPQKGKPVEYFFSMPIEL